MSSTMPEALRSQSPDGDFFDPELDYWENDWSEVDRHSPLTGIFLIRSHGGMAHHH